MDFNWLRDFESLARTLNFTRASEERNVTQSAFSRRIKALENWVGTPLVNRATYPVQLTEAGKQLLPVALAAVAQLSETRQAIRAADRGDRVFVRFAVLHTISVNYLNGRIDELQARFPDLRTRVRSDALSTCCELLVEGAVDIMLCYYHHAVSPTINDASFARKDLQTDPLIPVGLAQAVQAHGWDLHQSRGPAIPYLAYEKSSFLGMVVDTTIEERALNVDTIYVDALVETIKRRLLRGSGFAWMPQSAITDELEQGILVPIGDESLRTNLSISALSHPAALDPAARRMWEAL